MGWDSAIRRLGRTDWASDAQSLAMELRAIFQDIADNGVESLILTPPGDVPAVTIRRRPGTTTPGIQTNTGGGGLGGGVGGAGVVGGPGGGGGYTGIAPQTPATPQTVRTNFGQLTALTALTPRQDRRLDPYEVTDANGVPRVAISSESLRGPETDVPGLDFTAWPGLTFPPTLTDPTFTPGDLTNDVNRQPNAKFPDGWDWVPPPGQTVEGDNDPGGSNWPDGWPTNWPPIDVSLTSNTAVGVGAGRVFLGEVVSGTGSGPYTVRIDTDGGRTSLVSATVPQIDEADVVPAGTWVYVVGRTNAAGTVTYKFQPPVFLADPEDA